MFHFCLNGDIHIYTPCLMSIFNNLYFEVHLQIYSHFRASYYFERKKIRYVFFI